MNNEVFNQIYKLQENGKKGILATLVSIFGSVPQNAGSKLLLTENGLFGTIGGGELEYETEKMMKDAIAKPFRPRIIEVELTEEGNGMQCGGSASLFLEPVGSWQRCFIFGAGHVCQQLYPLLQKLDFQCMVYDNRKDYCRALDIPVEHIEYEKIAETLDIGPYDYVIIITHSHDLDAVCLEQTLNSDPYYLGMIGSQLKSSETKNILINKGFSKEKIEGVHSPIGIKMPSKTPIEIAVSIAGELIIQKRAQYE